LVEHEGEPQLGSFTSQLAASAANSSVKTLAMVALMTKTSLCVNFLTKMFLDSVDNVRFLLFAVKKERMTLGTCNKCCAASD